LLGHGIGEAAAFHDILLELAADLGGNAFRFQMSHAVESDGQGHAGIEEVGQLLGEGGQFLELGFALLGEPSLDARGQQGTEVRFGTGGTARDGYSTSATFGGFHHDGEQAGALDLEQGSGAVGGLEDAFDDFAGTTTGFVRELWHKTVTSFS
jgi:hypothetical protein